MTDEARWTEEGRRVTPYARTLKRGREFSTKGLSGCDIFVQESPKQGGSGEGEGEDYESYKFLTM